MGKQKAHRRQAMQAKEAARQQTEGKGLEVLNAVKDQFPADSTPASASAKPAPQKVEIPMTVAGKKEYDEFFRLYNLWAKAQFRVRLSEGLAGREGGMYFLPLGFIPGPAILLSFREGQVQAVEATPDVKRGLKVPATWTKIAEMPQRIQQALEEWKVVIEGLGYEPSPWNLGFARGVLGGQLPSKYLAMAMPHFRYRPGDPELPLGVVLVPTEGGMKLVLVYNPRGIPDSPAVSTVLSLAILKDGRGPVQKLLRTWALMEGNYLGRYDRDGNPRR